VERITPAEMETIDRPGNENGEVALAVCPFILFDPLTAN
jgi:hypothetical protein